MLCIRYYKDEYRFQMVMVGAGLPPDNVEDFEIDSYRMSHLDVLMKMFYFFRDTTGFPIEVENPLDFVRPIDETRKEWSAKCTLDGEVYQGQGHGYEEAMTALLSNIRS